MAASDNTSSAAAALRRLASLDEATLQGALSCMGREPFRRLRRAVGHTETLLPSDDEGGSGPAGAQGSSSPFRLDPAENVTNQVTASSEANVNNLDPALGTDSFLAAVSSPTTSMATQDPVWPPASGGLTSLESYLISTEAIDTAQPLGEPLRDTAAAAGDPTSYGWLHFYVSHGAYYLGRGRRPAGRDTARSATNKIAPQRADPDPVLPTARGRRSANWRTKLDRAAKPSTPSVPRKQPPACFAQAQKRHHPPSPRRPPHLCPSASRLSRYCACALPGDQQAPPTKAIRRFPETNPVQ